MTVHEVFISLSDNFSVVSDSDKRQNLQTPPVSALTPHEGRRYQGIASETLSSKADQQSNIVWVSDQSFRANRIFRLRAEQNQALLPKV